MAATRSRNKPGSAALSEVLRTLKDGWPAGVTLLTGEDLFHLDAAQRALLDALVPAKDAEYGLTVYSDKKVDVAAVIAAVRSLGMFAARRVVLVRDADALDGDPRALVEYSGHPPANSYLLVRAPKLDRRRKIAQALTKAGTVLTFGPPADSRGAVRDVLAIAKSKQLKLDPQAAIFLAEICCGDFYRVSSELEKIGCWIGSGKTGVVDTAVVHEVAAGSGLLSGWEVADAILVRDRAGAHKALHRILESGDAPLQLLGGLAFRARSMIKAKLLIGRGMDAQGALRAARLWGADPASAERGLARYSTAELLAFPSILFDADRTLKSRGLAPAAVLGSLIDRLTTTRVRATGTR
jgi:DNA polymerase-3 subunit delta